MNHAKALLRDNIFMINTSCLFINTSRLADNTQPGHTYLQVNIVIVKRVINPYAYELDLPRAYGVHSVFHVNLMNPVATDPLEGH